MFGKKNMICPKCGMEVPDDSVFCPECGAKIERVEYKQYDANAAHDVPPLKNSSLDRTQNLYQQPYQRTKEPFFVQNYNVSFSSVSSFLSSLRDQSGLSEPDMNRSDPYEHNVPIVPDSIQPEDNEIIVKQYNIAKLRTRLKLMKAEGRLMVTNRRVLFRAAGTSLTGNIYQQHQFNLDEIGGIEIHKDYKFSMLSFLGCVLMFVLTFVLAQLWAAGIMVSIFKAGNRDLFGVYSTVLTLVGLASVIPTFVVYKHFWIKLFLLILGILCIFTAGRLANNGFVKCVLVINAIFSVITVFIVCFVPNLVIKIKTKGANGAVVIGCQKAMALRQAGDDYTGFAEVLPWEDTVMAMNELGTMIDDLQKLGDYAVEKWS